MTLDENKAHGFSLKSLLRRVFKSNKDLSIQGSMWDSMQRSGYFRNNAEYSDWSPDKERPPSPVLKTDKSPPKVLPDFLSDIDFGSDEVVLGLQGDPMERFGKDIDPALKETEEIWLQRMAKLNSEMVVLDIGCGYGRTEAWLWRYVREVHGVDISPYIIDICKERFKDIDNVHFWHNKGDDLSLFEPNKFDFVYSFNVFQHIPRRFTESYLKGIKRILKNDGMSLFNVFSGMNYDVDDGPYGVDWAIGYSHEDMERKIVNSGLKVSRVFKWRLKGIEPHWIWFAVSK